ncbi:glutamine--fructose-6-phosphate transaminase (isomerizing) [Wenzhouxiangella sp. XN79A]|uniref:glutamine--fructose-6-phosphate transaminase (isomerizing) n=1 Tax=Wenzhouxiangella sp. XN79A TaxID=2724193 RepID=UPI00144A764C|nr:glutamine--fructose-6-phosphate transaminase (isomerizing) [Wenzhouxiangella sp. XN79A]NKI33657.1 glutamine--fructose-6-phosphate transaminase (isomerizing) [Wenzhouxiangella sp. XN79A]
MCGIVAAIAERNVVPLLIDGLKRLEYRGYDSAGLAFVDHADALIRERSVGKVAALAGLLGDGHAGHVGLAHTRWATHGRPSEANAHPHLSDERIAVVHNGIIENHEALKKELEDAGYRFASETDSEVIAHLIHRELDRGAAPDKAIRAAVDRLAGSFALGVLDRDHPDRLWGVRHGSPLVIGVGVGEHFLASDAAALVPLTQQMMFLDDGDIACLRLEQVEVFDLDGEPATRDVRISSLPADSADRGHYRHFMLKEIHEQPGAIAETLDGALDGARVLPSLDPDLLKRVRAIHILACGTSYHAGMVARYWIEQLAGLPVTVEIASEYRYRQPAVPNDTLMLAISQSGETADTLAALERSGERRYLARLGICNVPESALTRACDHVLMTRAGLEIGVASTKAFTTQLSLLLLLAAALGREHGLGERALREVTESLGQVVQQAREVLTLEDRIEELAAGIADKHHALFLGRGPEFPIALEGALKLKEVSYIHAEGYAAGELKHGPLALVDDDLPVIVSASSNRLLEKLKGNLHEVRARGGQMIVFADRNVTLASGDGIEVVHLPIEHSPASPILQVLPLQLLAYHVGVLRGTDVDQPRNLAKSVTVE